MRNLYRRIELSFRAENAEESFNLSDLHETAKNLQSQVDGLRAELSIALANAETLQEENRQLREERNSELIQRFREEIRQLTLSLEDKDFELKNLQDRLSIAEQQTILNEIVIESNDQPIQHESLLRATAATSNAVNNLLATASPNQQFEAQISQGFPSVHQGSENLTHSTPYHAQEIYNHPQQYQQAGYLASDWPQTQEMYNHEHQRVQSHQNPQNLTPQRNYEAQQDYHSQAHHNQLIQPHQQSSHGHQHFSQNQSVNPTENPSKLAEDSAQSRPIQQADFVIEHGYQTGHRGIHEVQPSQETPVLAASPVPTPRDGTEPTNLQVSPLHDIPFPHLSTNTEKDLFAENQLLRECVNETSRMHDSLGTDVERLQELRAELETAIEALQAEIWSLNGQLKASVLDRENLSDRVADLDSQLIVEKRRADQLDQELSEQVEMTEKAQRQAAESENESNRRLAECLEMENRREELEKAYAQLMEYYTQLHGSYEALYKSVNASKQDGSTETELTTTDVSRGQEALRLYEVYRQQFTTIREQISSLREAFQHFAQDLTRTDLVALESSLNVELARIEAASRRVAEIRQNLSNSEPFDQSEEISETINSLIQDCGLEIPMEADLMSKIDEVAAILQSKIKEIEETRKAVLQQQRISQALEERLSMAESNIGVDTSRELAETQMLLRQRNFEVSELQARVEELKEAVTELTASREEEKADRGGRDERDLRTEVAILAARLATRQADVDSLFRANADLAHTNVRLQNEVDELQERRGGDGEGDDEQNELERLREMEISLNDQLAALDRKLSEDRRKIADLERQLEEAKNRASIFETQLHSQQELLNVQQSTQPDQELLDELNRLKDVEKLLNQTITGFEEKLMEAEERIHELEIEIDETKEKEGNDESSKAEKTDEGWGWGDDEEVEVAAIQQSTEPSNDLKSDLMSAELKIKEEEKKRQEAEERAEWMEKELEEMREESEGLMETITQLKTEQVEGRRRIGELENDLHKAQSERAEFEQRLEEIGKEKKDDDWGESWNEEEPTDQLNKALLEAETEKSQRIEAEQQKELLKQKVQSLLEQIDRLETDFLEKIEEKDQIESELKAKVAELEREKAEFEEKMENTEKNNDWGNDEWNERPDQTNEEIKEKLAEAETVVLTLRAELDSREEALDEMRRRAETLQSQLDHTEIQRQHLVEQLSQLEDQKTNNGWGDEWNESSNGEVETIRSQLKETIEEREALQQIRQKLGDQVESLTKKLDETESNYEEILDELRTEVGVLREKLEEANNEIGELRQQLERSEPESTKDEEWGWGNDEKNDEEAKTNEQITELESRLEDLSLKLAVAERQIEEKDLRLGEVKNLENQMEIEIDDLRATIKTITQELAERSEKLNEAEISLQNNQNLKSEVENLKEQLNRLKIENEEMKNNLEIFESQKKANDEQEETWGWEDNSEKPQNDQNTNDELLATIEALKQEIEKSTEVINSLKLEIQKKEIDAVDSLELQETLQGEVNELLHRLQENEKELGSERREKIDIQQHLQQSKQQMDLLSTELNELKVEREQMKGSSDGEMEEIRSQLQAARTKCALLMDSESRLLEQVDEYGAQADIQREEAERLQAVINNLEAQILDQEELKNRISELEKELQEKNLLSQETNRDDQDEQAKKLQELKKTLEKKEEKIESLILGKQEAESRLGEIQRRLQSVEQERDTAKRLYDELRAKLAAAKRKATAGSGTTTLAASRRSSVASTSAPLDQEIPEEPTFDSRLHTSSQHSPRFDSSLDSTTSQYPLEMTLGELSEKFEVFLAEIGDVLEINHEYIDQIRSTFKTLTERNAEGLAENQEETQNDIEIIDRMIARQNLIDELRREVEQLRDELREKEIECGELQAQIDSLDSLKNLEKAKVAELKSSLQDQAKEFLKESTQLKEDLEGKNLEVQQLKDFIEESTEVQLKMENDRDRLREELDRALGKIEELDQENQGLQEKMLIAEQRALKEKDLVDQMKSLEEENLKLDKKLKDASDAIERLQEKLEESAIKLSESENEKEDQQKIVVKAKETEDNLRQKLGNIQIESEQIIKKQAEEMEELKGEVERSERNLNQCKTTISTLEQQVSTLSSETKAKDQKIQSITSQLSELNEELNFERDNSRRISENLEASRLEIVELQEQISLSTRETEMLETKLFGIEAENSNELEQKELLIKDLESKLCESLSKMALLQGSIERMTEESESLRSTNTISLNSEFEVMKIENETLKSDLYSKNAKLVEMEGKIREIESKHLQTEKEMQEEMERFERQMIKMGEEKRRQQEQLENLSNDLARSQRNLQEKMDEISRFEAEKLRNESEIERLRGEILQLSTDREMIAEELKTSENSLQQQRELNDEQNEKLEMLSIEVQDLQQKLSEKNTMEAVEEKNEKMRVEQAITLPLGGAASEEVQHLRSDCVRLESQLRTAHDSIQELQKEIFCWQQRVESRDRSISELRTETTNLRSQLQHLHFENEQLRRSISNQDPTERIIEMEREVNEIKTRLQNRNDALMEDLRAAEQQLELKSQREQEAIKNAENSAEVAEEWRVKWETAMQEAEALRRCAEETARLGNALERSRFDQMDLARQLEEAEQTAKRAQQEKDALHAQLTIVSQQLEDRTERLRKAGEAKMQNMLRLVELESRLNASRLTVAEQRRTQITSPELVSSQVLSSNDENDLHPSREELMGRLSIAEARIRELEDQQMRSPVDKVEGTEQENFISSISLDRSLEEGMGELPSHSEREIEEEEFSQADDREEEEAEREESGDQNPPHLRSPWCFNNPDF